MWLCFEPKSNLISLFLVFLDPLGNSSALIIKFLHKLFSSLLASGKIIHAYIIPSP
jgi:hypothetical protein